MDQQTWRSASAEERLKVTDFIVEATHFEQFSLWERWHKEVTWQQDNGYLITVGKVNKLPVCFSLTWDIINGKRIGFYHATSRMVDHEMIDKWFEKNFKGTYDNGHRRAATDADNFAHCLNYVREPK